MPADRLGSLAQRALSVSAWTLLSRILGLLRDRLWAGTLGGSLALDAFLAAFALPNLLRNLFGEGALTSALIPRYVQQREQDPQGAERFAGTVVTPAWRSGSRCSPPSAWRPPRWWSA